MNDLAHNRLATETSPYLLQHAHNPVDWYPWGEAAFARARAEDKPILLSIGYSACHWCHVMAHESFEDAATARLMNERYVNIKVDREERPDLDRIYQTAHQLLARRPGGWPLTMFLTADGVPFFGGTYFPPTPRHGLPAFTDIIGRIADFHRDRRAELVEQNASVLEALRGLSAGSAATAGRLDDTPLRAARADLAASFDRAHGGFGAAPKFPHPAELALLLRLAPGGDAEAGGIALATLHAMAAGGLYDQIGGGFFRYAVDERWEIPHFEKMLYDNGPLLGLYVHAWQLSGEVRFRDVAIATAEWALRTMQLPDGGFAATLDADSGGMEGGYYLWTREAADTTAGDAGPIARVAFGLDRPANFEGRWHLNRRIPDEALAEQFRMSPEAVRRHLEHAIERLLIERRRRSPPGRDDKVLAGWNGLMIKALADAGRGLGEARFVAAAERALDFVHDTLVVDGRLRAGWKDGRAPLPAYLDDHAFLLDAVLALLEARWRSSDLAFAVLLADALLDHFEDEAHGGFFFTADDAEPLIQRPKPFADDATPSGNGVAARALARLGHLTGDLHYLNAAERTLRAAWTSLGQYPAGHGALLAALAEHLTPPTLVVLRGTPAALGTWRAPLDAAFAPDRMLLAIPSDAGDLPASLAEQRPQGEAIAYVCTGDGCLPPFTDAGALWRHFGLGSRA